MNNLPIDRTIQEFSSIFTSNGHVLYIVGGAVRDALLKRDLSDYDFSTDATPDEMKKMFRSVIPTGIAHGTLTILFKGEMFEVTTFRTDGEYLKHRKPSQVSFITDLKEDLIRRDFTINALAVDTRDGILLDYVEGKTDLKKKVIRSIGDPHKRFHEDALRMLRACRFAATLSFTIEEGTLHAMKEMHSLLSHVSGERVHIELFKILHSPLPSVAFAYMFETGILETLFPEIAAGFNVTQREMHQHDVMFHSFYTCDAAPQSEVLVRLAALLHDVGKPFVKEISENGTLIFHQHEKESVRIAKKILKRIKCSNEESETVLHLIAHHMFHYTSEWSDAAVRRFIHGVGEHHIDQLFALRIADMKATNHPVIPGHMFDEFRSRIEEQLQNARLLSLRDLEVNGEDLAGIGIPKGPLMGKVLHELFDTVLEDPAQNTRQKLLEIARKFYDQRLDLLR